MSEDEDNEQKQEQNETRAEVEKRGEREHRRKEGEENEDPNVKKEYGGEDRENSTDHVEGREEDDLDIPQFGVEKNLRLESVKQVEKKPSEEWRTEEVPQFNTSDVVLLRPEEQEDNILIEEEVDSVDVAQFETVSSNWLEPMEMDDNPPDELEPESQIEIPQIETSRSNRIKKFENFLCESPTEVIGLDTQENIVEEEVIEKEQEETESVSGAESESAGGGESLEEWPDPIELLFGVGGGNITSDEPVVICLDDTERDGFLAVLETLVKSLYCIKVGGKPDSTRFSDAAELVEETRWVEAEDNIFTVKLEEDEWNKLEHEFEEDWRKIWQNRVRNELYTEDFGAIIFNRQFTYFSEPDDHFPKIILLNPSIVPSESIEKLLRLFWGCWEWSVQADDFSFGQLFNFHGERVVERRWNSIENAEQGLFLDATDPDEDAGEIHRRMKILVVKWLVERIRVNENELDSPMQIEEVVETEKKFFIGDNLKAVADVFSDEINDSPKDVFEVETLFAENRGSGKPRDKLRSTFMKYENVDDVNEINIVLSNITVMLHLKTITELKQKHRDWEKKHGKKVHFYTLNLEDETIVPIRSVVEDLKDLEEELRSSQQSNLFD